MKKINSLKSTFPAPESHFNPHFPIKRTFAAHEGRADGPIAPPMLTALASVRKQDGTDYEPASLSDASST